MGTRYAHAHHWLCSAQIHAAQVYRFLQAFYRLHANNFPRRDTSNLKQLPKQRQNQSFDKDKNKCIDQYPNKCIDKYKTECFDKCQLRPLP